MRFHLLFLLLLLLSLFLYSLSISIYESYRGSHGRSNESHHRSLNDKDEDEKDDYNAYKNVKKDLEIRETTFNCSMCAKCMQPTIKKSAICSYCRQNCGIGNN